MAAPFNRILTVDGETRWARSACDWAPDGYTLSKSTTEEYIRSPLFKAFGFCFHEYGSADEVLWVSHTDLPLYLAQIDWSTTAVLAHNAMFDVSILSYIYGVRPCFIFDSLSMARALRGAEGGNSLAQLAKDYGLPAKGMAINSTDGLWDLPPHVEQELAEYCAHDVRLAEQVFAKLLYRIDPQGNIGGEFPKKELRLIDMTMRMYTDPVLHLDGQMLQEALKEEAEKRAKALERAGVEEAELASNGMFAEVLRRLGTEPPTKVSKTTGKEAFAFAKNDALFQAMLNGDDEDVALVCEARLKVKSTMERTRAQRFVDISHRGALPVPLAYYGAGTGRWAAAKGANINLQNLKRGSFLRKAIMAPEGYALGVADLSQIEPRVLAWLSDYEELLDIFRAGGDPYAAFGAQMFTLPGMTKESHPTQRQSAKSALLGCFAADTQVLTELRGWVTITDVSTEDRVWDGVEWVTHQGVLDRGVPEVLPHQGVCATSDHEILTERGWAAWNEVRRSPSLFQSALSSASLPVSNGPDAKKALSGGAQACGNHECAAPADGKALLHVPTCEAAEQLDATPAQKRKHTEPACCDRGLNPFAQTLSIESACLPASRLSSVAAQTRRVKSIRTTAAAASRYIRRGWMIVLRFCDTSLLLTAGTNRNCNSIAETTTGTTSPATCASSRAASTWKTNDASPPEKSSPCASGSPTLKVKTRVYDIALAGPRNRFTILTDAGPLIVHNCGYQLGWSSFAAQLLTGFLGAPPKRYDKTEAKQLGVTAQMVQDFLSWEDNIVRMNEIPHTCTDEELLIHCLAAKAIIDKYRSAAAPVTGFWELLQELIAVSLVGGKEYNHKDVLLFRKEEIVMANGMSLRYPGIEVELDKKGRPQYSYMDGKKRRKLYAGKICNNVTQGSARIVMSDGLLRVDPVYRVLGTVHDEGISLVPEDEAQDGYKWMIRQMTLPVKWMPGIPLAADGGVHKRYGLAKN